MMSRARCRVSSIDSPPPPLVYKNHLKHRTADVPPLSSSFFPHMKKRPAKTKVQPKLAEKTINMEVIERSVDDAKATLDALYLLLNAVIAQLAEVQGRGKK